jgi:hypothetical protein
MPTAEISTDDLRSGCTVATVEGRKRGSEEDRTLHALTMLFSGVSDAFVLHAGRMEAGNLLYVTGSMWSRRWPLLRQRNFQGEHP